MAYAEEQKKYISEAGAKIAECRKEYTETKNWCMGTGNLQAWEYMEPAIKAKAEFYKGEVLRAKHNIARYMLGRDPQESRKIDTMYIEYLDDWLGKVAEDVLRKENDWATLQEANERDKEFYAINYEIACGLQEMAIREIKNLTDTIRRVTYNGEVR